MAGGNALAAILLLAVTCARPVAWAAEIFAHSRDLLPTDNGHPKAPANKTPHTQYVGHLAGPWGLPISSDVSHLFGDEGRDRRHAARRVVVFYDLNVPMETYRRARAAIDREGGSEHVLVVTVGFPTASRLRGLRLPRPACAARWHQDYDWLSNRPVPVLHRQHCKAVGHMPTPCELLLGLVERFRAPLFPNLEHVTVSGFSAGGQLLDRCMYSVRRTVDPYLLGQMKATLTLAHHGGPWQCHDWDEQDERHLRLGRQVFRQRQVCEQSRDDGFMYRFTHGDESLAPGCGGGCHCCKREGHVDISRGLHHVSFIIVSPSTLLYPVPERAVLPDRSKLKCHSFDPKSVLKRSYRFEVPADNVVDMASVSKTPNKKACQRYNHYRYGLQGRVPPDMQTGGEVSDWTVRRAILGHHALYIAGSADVCNWELQKEMSPQCGFCKYHRSIVARPSDKRFSFDYVSPVVSSCGAMWQGMTRFERMKIYKDLLEQVVAPRFGIFPAELKRRRHFRVMIGVGHDDHDVLQRLGNCFANGHCSSGPLVPMEDFPHEEPRSDEVVFFKKFDDEPHSERPPRARTPTSEEAETAPGEAAEAAGGHRQATPERPMAAKALLAKPLVLEAVGSAAVLMSLAALACMWQRFSGGRRRGASATEMYLVVEESGRQELDDSSRQLLAAEAGQEPAASLEELSAGNCQVFVNSSPRFDSRLPTA